MIRFLLVVRWKVGGGLVGLSCGHIQDHIYQREGIYSDAFVGEYSRRPTCDFRKVVCNIVEKQQRRLTAHAL